MFSSENKAHYKVLSKREILSEQKIPDFKSRIFLFFSIFILFVAFLLIFSDNSDLIMPGRVIGDSENPITWTVFLVGIGINFFLVPFLYWSSYEKFKKNDEFWDMEFFWILPLSFFGTFFQYLSDLPYILVTIPLSLFTIMVVHLWLMIVSKDLMTIDEQFENTSRYFRSFTYLTAYYVMLVVLVFSFDLFNKIGYWVG